MNAIMESLQRPGQGGVERGIQLDVDGVQLEGTLALPDQVRGIVIFAHGSGSSRNSPRNRLVARLLQEQGMGTLLFDLLTAREESVDRRTGELRFKIPFLARRLVGATELVMRNKKTRDLKIGYFGASTGAAAALLAGAELPDRVSAIVSRGGRPDLAGAALRSVTAPTLLIVGGNDTPVIAMNRQALAQLKSPEKKLVLVPGASHLFEEPGALEDVASLASEWFERYLCGAGGRAGKPTTSPRR